MQTEPEKKFKFDMRASEHAYIELTPRDPSDFYIFDINVTQNRQIQDDIHVMVMDETNFRTWQVVAQAIKAGANSTALPQYLTDINTKHCWGTLVFLPRDRNAHYLVLDNSHSSMTAKHVEVTATVLTFESTYRRSVRNTASSFKSEEFWKLYLESEKNFKEGKNSAACGSARTSLLILWKMVCEIMSRNTIVFNSGKSPDIGILKTGLQPYAPAYMINQISQAWAIGSELYHVEKRGGKEPSPNETLLALNAIYTSMDYLCSLLPKN